MTRDRTYQDGYWGDREFKVVDTGVHGVAASGNSVFVFIFVFVLILAFVFVVAFVAFVAFLLDVVNAEFIF